MPEGHLSVQAPGVVEFPALGTSSPGLCSHPNAAAEARFGVGRKGGAGPWRKLTGVNQQMEGLD